MTGRRRLLYRSNQWLSALACGAVDVIVADEPFASRLAQQKVWCALADYHEMETARRLLGGLFLNGMLTSREDVIASQPDLMERTVRAILRTLAWIEAPSRAQIVDALAPPPTQGARGPARRPRPAQARLFTRRALFCRADRFPRALSLQHRDRDEAARLSSGQHGGRAPGGTHRLMSPAACPPPGLPSP